MRWLRGFVLFAAACGGGGGIDVFVRGGDFDPGTPVYVSIREDENMAPGRALACGRGVVGTDAQFEVTFSGVEEVPIYRFDVAFDRDANGACEDPTDLVLFQRVDGALSGGTFLSPYFTPIATSNAPCISFADCD